MALFLNLLFAHLVSDFWLQWDGMVKDKGENRIKGWALHLHVVIVFACSLIVSGEVSFWKFALGIAAAHLVFDWIKTYFGHRPLIPFVVDQVLHIGCLGVVSVLYAAYFGEWRQFAIIGRHNELQIPAFLCILVIVTRPANILIKELFELCGLFKEELKCEMGGDIDLSSRDGEEDQMKNAGAIVGILERLLAFAFVAKGNYQALGFLLTAKSILRFKLDNAKKAEYVLVGTLLSMFIVIVCVIAVQYTLPRVNVFSPLMEHIVTFVRQFL